MSQITKLADVLRAAEKNTGSKVKLAQAMNVAPSAVTYWFQGRNTPKLEHYFKLLELAGKRAALIVLTVCAAYATVRNGDAVASQDYTLQGAASTRNWAPDPMQRLSPRRDSLHIIRISIQLPRRGVDVK